MKNEKNWSSIIEKVGKKEIKKIRHSYKENNSIDEYLYKSYEKIFTKLVFPYFRFEILLRLIKDILNQNEHYPKITEKDMKKVKLTFKRLQKICFYLNIALDEFNKMLSFINKYRNS